MILIVEDNDDARRYLSVLLRRTGQPVFTARDGEEALRVAANHPPALFLLDYMMPGMNGLELFSRLRADPAYANARVLFLSAAFNKDLARQAVRDGAVDWLVKGTHGAADILAAVNRALPNPPSAPSH